MVNKVLHNSDHVLHRLLLLTYGTLHNYSLTLHAHDRALPDQLSHLRDCNFIICMSFYRVYWQYCVHVYIFELTVLQLHSNSWTKMDMLCYVTLNNSLVGRTARDLLLTLPFVRKQNTVISMSICHTQHLGTTCPKFTTFSVHVACGSVLLW